jgi:predicted component of type VI protein secretion system
MASKMSAAAEIEQLRKKLMHARNIISELKDELKEQENMRYKITAVSHFYSVFNLVIGA